jgi:glycerol-3-phosphate cytidylyltransferase
MKDRDKTIIRGFTCGTMDLLHAGHILMLKEVKEQCHYLVVGLHTDPTIDRPDKNKPIQSVEERRIQLEAVKYVDEIVEYDTEEDLVKLLKEISPQVRFVGEDWKDNPNLTGIDLPIKIVFNTRDHNYSSTELRDRILNK